MTATTTPLRLGAVVLDCDDPRALAAFYAELLHWEVRADEDGGNDWVDVVSPEGGVTVSFQRDPDHQPPTWRRPERPQMLHLDVKVPDLDAEHERAVALGAKPLDEQRTFRVYADPAGHPFCLCAC